MSLGFAGQRNPPSLFITLFVILMGLLLLLSWLFRVA